MTTSGLGAEMFEGQYTHEGDGSFKDVYVDHEAGKIAYVPKRGEDVRERLENVLAWEHNLETLEENGLTVPLDDYEVVVGPVDGEETAVLVGEYDPSVRSGHEMVEPERGEYQEEFDRYAETIEELMEDGEYIAIMHGEYDGWARRRNLGVSDDGAVVLDFGEAGWLSGVSNWIGIRLKAAEVYRERDRFLEDHGIVDRVDAVLGEEDGLYDRLKGLF